MNCIKCGTDVRWTRDSEADIDYFVPTKEDLNENLKELQVPFICPDCGGIDFPVRSINHIVYLWPKPTSDFIGSIFIPEKYREEKEQAIVLSCGKKFYSKKAKKFLDIEIVPGDFVIYDVTTPWTITIFDRGGMPYEIKYMSYVDLIAIIQQPKGEKNVKER